MTLSKLSWRNAQRQARDYLVYFVTVVMAAALIYALLNDFSLEKAGEFATAASALKQTILGDFNLSNLPEVYALMNGNVSGRVQR